MDQAWRTLSEKALARDQRTFVLHPALQKDENLIDLYNNFLSTIEREIDPLLLVEIVEHVVKQFKDEHSAIKFLLDIEAKVQTNKEAQALCKILEGEICVDLLYNDMTIDPKNMNAFKREPDTLTIKKRDEWKNEVRKITNSISLDSSNSTNLHASFYHLMGCSCLVEENHVGYYQWTMKYLESIDISTLDEKRRTDLCVFLMIAVFVEKNFKFFRALQSPNSTVFKRYRGLSED